MYLTLESARLTALVLNALHGLLFFYQRDHRELNVDGLFGLRLIEGQLKHLWIDVDTKTSLSAELKNLSDSAASIANIALPFVYDRDPDYFIQFQYLVNRPYDVLHKQHRDVDRNLLWPKQMFESKAAKKPFNERQSDKCYEELLSSASARDTVGGGGSLCNISQACFDYQIGRRGLKQYKITHQILYVSLAELAGCTATLEEKMIKWGTSVDKFIVEWCTNMVEELDQFEKHNSHFVGLSFSQKDLLMEQILTCGQFGFVETSRLNVLMAILSWQDPVLGCFRAGTAEESSQNSTTAATAGVGRKLLSEFVTADSCSAHGGAVAAGALTSLLRFLVDPPTSSSWRLDEQTAFPRRVPAEGLFKTFDHVSWVTLDVPEGAPPPLRRGWDFFAFTALLLLILLLYCGCRFFCRRRVKQFYHFAYKNL